MTTDRYRRPRRRRRPTGTDDDRSVPTARFGADDRSVHATGRYRRQRGRHRRRPTGTDGDEPLGAFVFTKRSGLAPARITSPRY
jgi:hypothetical protein